MSKIGLLLAIVTGIVACSDPPLLSTPLPNGYSFQSNGGEFGHVRRPDGTRMAEYFGILDDGEERWCGRFGWEGDIVLCELVEYTKVGLETKSKGYFFLNTQTDEATIYPSNQSIQTYWAAHSRAPFPSLARSYAGTMSK